MWSSFSLSTYFTVTIKTNGIVKFSWITLVTGSQVLWWRLFQLNSVAKLWSSIYPFSGSVKYNQLSMTKVWCGVKKKRTFCREIWAQWIYFHRIGPLGQFGLVVAMSGCMHGVCVVSPSHAILLVSVDWFGASLVRGLVRSVPCPRVEP